MEMASHGEDWKNYCNFVAVKIVRTSFLPFHGFSAVNLLGVLFVFFYLAYFMEWLVRLPMRGNAYRNISFEREAYANQRNLDYLQSRPHYAWRRYMKRPTHKR